MTKQFPRLAVQSQIIKVKSADSESAVSQVPIYPMHNNLHTTPYRRLTYTYTLHMPNILPPTYCTLNNTIFLVSIYALYTTIYAQHTTFYTLFTNNSFHPSPHIQHSLQPVTYTLHMPYIIHATSTIHTTICTLETTYYGLHTSHIWHLWLAHYTLHGVHYTLLK